MKKNGFQKGHKSYLKKHSKETRQKMSECKLGDKNPSWNGGKVERECVLDECQNIFMVYPNAKSAQRFCSKQCTLKCPERKASMKASRLGKFGELANNWRGGTTPLAQIIRASSRYKDWRSTIFRRDKWVCQLCSRVGGRMVVDHIKPFSVILLEHKLLTIEDALTCDELWDEANGRVLCNPCHLKTETYGGRKK